MFPEDPSRASGILAFDGTIQQSTGIALSIATNGFPWSKQQPFWKAWLFRDYFLLILLCYSAV